MSYNIVKSDGTLQTIAGRPSFNESQYSKKADIVDNLDSTEVYKPLSANMGNKIGDMVGDAFSSSKAYVVGDLCIYNNTLYKCILAHTGQLPTNTTYWSTTSVGGEISDVKSNISLGVENWTGKYIGGKKLYERIYHKSQSTAYSKTYMVLDSSLVYSAIDLLVEYNGDWGNGTSWYCMSNNTGSSAGFRGGVNADGVWISIENTSITEFVVRIQYTKI